MVKYLLTVFGDFEKNGMAQDLALSMTPIVDSPHLKFQYTKGAMIFHFESEVDRFELHDYIVGITYGMSNCFILTTLDDRVSVHMSKSESDNLFDLENESKDLEIRLKSNKSFNDDDEDEDETSVALLLESLKSQITKPSLNSILEKIKKTGIDSLTQFEKDTLDEYSKN